MAGIASEEPGDWYPCMMFSIRSSSDFADTALFVRGELSGRGLAGCAADRSFCLEPVVELMAGREPTLLGKQISRKADTLLGDRRVGH